jgi:hypothetical protein
MEFNLISGTLPAELFMQVIDIDRQTLPEKYVTSLDKLIERTEACPESFITVSGNEQLLGYINFFPIVPSTLQELISGNIPNDIVLGRNDVIAYTSTREMDVYIITIAIRPEWQHTLVIRLLTRHFADFIRKKSDEGILIRHLYASVISESGEKLLRRMGFLPLPVNPHIFFTPATLLQTL